MQKHLNFIFQQRQTMTLKTNIYGDSIDNPDT